MAYRVKLLGIDSKVFYSYPLTTLEAAFYLARVYDISGKASACDIQTQNKQGRWFNLGIYNDGLEKPDYGTDRKEV